MKTRRRHSTESRATLALEAIKAERTNNEIAMDYEVHPVQVQQGKKLALSGMVFGSKRGSGGGRFRSAWKPISVWRTLKYEEVYLKAYSVFPKPSRA
jgi:transposase-like protein